MYKLFNGPGYGHGHDHGHYEQSYVPALKKVAIPAVEKHVVDYYVSS